MRKIFAIAIVAGFTAALTGCGDDRKNTIRTANKDEPVPKLVSGGTGGAGGDKKAPAAPTSTEK